MRNIRIIIVVICTLLFVGTFGAAAQNEASLRGSVIDKATGEPVGWSTVMLMKADSTIVTGTSCGSDGKYELKAPAGKYIFVADLLGYRRAAREVILKAGPTELEAIALEADNEMLAGAKVTDRVSLVEMKIDKVVVNISQSAFAQGSNALDLLKKSPGVTIDKDGNVKLNGKTVSVWIDGRPSYMDGKALETLLRSTGSESIEKFELMEHPSAKYDASGQGGIINIKTKRNLIQGFNGSIGAKGGGMYFSEIGRIPVEQGAWATLSYRTKKTNTVLNISEGTDETPINIGTNLTMEPENFRQQSESRLIDRSKHFNVKLANDWFVNDRNTVGAIISLPRSANSLASTSSWTKQYWAQTPVQETYSSINNGPSHSQQGSFNLNWSHIFDPARAAEMTANLDYYHNVYTDRNHQSDTVINVISASEPAYREKLMTNGNIYDIYSAKTDYQSVVWKKYMLEAGAKWALSRTNNTSRESNTGMEEIKSDFIYREHIAAAYASIAGQVNAKWSFKGGLRGEYTNYSGNWISSSSKTGDNYLNLFPTAYVGFQPSEKWRLSTSFSRRISRPSYGVLNPAKVFIDPKTYTIGNPEITPQYNTDVTFGAGYGQHYSFGLTYDRMRDVINQIPSYEGDGTQCLTWGNFGTIQMGIVTANISALPLAKWLEWTFGIYEIFSSTKSGITDKVRNSWSTQSYSEITLLLPKDWKVNASAFYTSPMKYGCYDIHSNFSADIAVKKNLFGDKLLLTAYVNDLFRTYSSDLDIIDETGAGTFSSICQRYYLQKAGLSVTWNFGKAQKPVRQRKVGNLEEASRAGNNNTIGK